MEKVVFRKMEIERLFCINYLLIFSFTFTDTFPFTNTEICFSYLSLRCSNSKQEEFYF